MNHKTHTSKRRICFVHLPKCGGRSLRYALRNPRLHWDTHKFRAHKADKTAIAKGRDTADYREECLKTLLNKRRYNYLMGHYPCSRETVEQFEDNWDFITLLRNPMDRWFSHYFYNRHKKKGEFRHELSLKEYLDSKGGMNSGSMYVRFFSHEKNERSDIAINDAIDNLRKFSLVGVLEEQDLFVSRFEEVFNRSLSIGHKNKSPVSNGFIQSEITEEIRTKVEGICMPDMRIYRTVIDEMIGEK